MLDVLTFVGDSSSLALKEDVVQDGTSRSVFFTFYGGGGI